MRPYVVSNKDAGLNHDFHHNIQTLNDHHNIHHNNLTLLIKWSIQDVFCWKLTIISFFLDDPTQAIHIIWK